MLNSHATSYNPDKIRLNYMLLLSKKTLTIDMQTYKQKKTDRTKKSLSWLNETKFLVKVEPKNILYGTWINSFATNY